MQQPPPPGGSQYGGPQPPGMSPFVSSSSAPRPPMQIHAEAASPINSRPPPTQPLFEELLPGGAGGNFPDDLGGDDTDRGGASGNRWPRQETLALLKIRSEMDATFRDATLKGPLWEEVSRKLAELGYRRSAKKCKEKFENVHKYYKRTKENRTGRPDGKTYRFFSQLEALHSATPSPTTPTQTSAPVLGSVPAMSMPVQLPVVSSTPATIGFSVTMAGSTVNRAAQMVNPMEATQHQQQPVLQTTGIHHGISGSATPTTGISFSSNTESSESDESDDEDTEEIGGSHEQGKRKRRSGSGSGGGSSKKIMQFFEGIMKQVMERQEAMQHKFLETIEKREQDRMIREEAWRRQEMARLSREQEILAQERAMAASRDAAVISFIQKMTGQNIPLPTIPAPVITVVPPPAPPAAPTVTTITLSPPQPTPLHHSHSHSHSHSHPSPKTPPVHKPTNHQPPPQQQPPSQPAPNHPAPHQHHQQSTDIIIRPSSTEIVLSNPDHSGSGFEHGSSSTSSRWPKAEVHALIKIRSDMDSRYQEAGPKGPLWEEISNGMKRLGYNRSSKRCKEKWENINKYFKKVKESNKKRPEDSKTCPYFHQLDALYRNKNRTGSADHLSNNTYPNNNSSHDSVVVTAPMTPQGAPQPISQQPPVAGGESHHNKIGNGGNDGGNNGPNRNGTAKENAPGTGGVQVVTTNGGMTPTFYGELKKPEDIMKDLMERRRQHETSANNNTSNYEKFDEGDDDSMEDNDVDEFDDDEDEEEEGDDRSSNQYKIQFQRPNVNVSGTGGTNQQTSSAPGATPGGNSFLAMVQ